MKQIAIYCPRPTERHNYVFGLIFNELLGLDYTYTSLVDEAHLSYGEKGSLVCVPHGLLSEVNIRPVSITADFWDTLWCFFKTGSGPLPYDVFAATFYLVSRYEEYLDYTPDDHHRFPATASILHKHSMLDQPIVNLWALKLKEILQLRYPEMVFQPRAYQFLSTLDIDQAWKYKNKGWLRNTLGLLRDTVHGNFSLVKERCNVLLRSTKDPYYTFPWLHDIHNRLEIAVVYFILIGNHGTYDKNTHPRNREFLQLIKSLVTRANTRVGIHPSYSSNSNANLLHEEFKRLNNAIGGSVVVSRQHYLMHSMPKTYQQLVDLGITEDHTMGYSTHLGFRAGIAAPFYFFDLQKNTITPLQLFPFCAMDITPLHYMEQDPAEAKQTLSTLLHRVKEVGGLFIPLWHNESLSETDRWIGWREVYQFLLEESITS